VIEGVWRSRGYGWLLETGPQGFAVHDVTEISRFESDRGGPGSFATAFEVEEEGAETVCLRHRGDVTRYWFDRVGAGASRPSPRSDDPVLNFDVFCRIFAENYAFFDLRGVDWADSYRQFRARVSEKTSAQGLLSVLAELIAPLKDAHVSITAGDQVVDVTSPIRERKAQLQQAFNVPAWMKDRQAYTKGLQAAFGEMFLNGKYRRTSNSMMIYGEISPGVGYVTLFGEFGHADTERARSALDLPRPRLDAASFLADEIAAIETALDEVATALGGMRAVIVDARLNYGGYDRLALAFAGRFTEERRVAYRKKAWTPKGFVSEQAIEITPLGPSLAHVTTVLLTSKQTVSAGEILVLAMTACPKVTTLGETTLGILSDNLYKRLPNGWEISLSNEVYEAPNGAIYEAVGIAPAVETLVFDPKNVRAGFHVAIDRALEFIPSRVLS
jgi:carboxyl-terminal processing protease